MSNKERVGVILDVSADVSKIEGSLGSLRNHLSGIQLPKGIGKELETRMSKLSDEIKNFQNLASKAGDSFEGAKQIDASYKKILEYARKVENSFSAIKDEANIDASKFFPKDVLDRIEKAEGAMADYYKAIEKGNESLAKQKKELKDIQSALDKNKKHQSELLAKQSGKKASRDAVVQEQTKVKTDKTAERNKEQQSLEILNKRKIALEAEKAAVENLTKKREAYNKAMQTYASKDTEEAANKISSASAAYAEAEEAAKQYGSTIRSISEIKLEQSNVATEISTTKAAIKSLGDEITAADTKIKKADEGYNSLTQELKENEAAAESFEQQMATLRTEIEQTEKAARAQGLQTLAKTLEEIGIKVDPTVDSLEDIQNAINNLKPEAIQAMSAALDKAGVDVNELGINLDKVGDKNKAFQEGAQEARRMNDQVEQLKGQVQQFFSLTNSVMLFRRGVQQAIETVKELDAAMTETAVVTDFSVGDMWEELPRYTHTANELGATTLGAYETMTLFYQQGLDTNEAFEVGTETMKMARIAGLEYADATNLMTAALRGFNMELDATSAAKVNDVYSELAAITAADTEEIATAMTKTASIAANANMEFETTAALLSQIIETTREPAETAGTAMKTIIARFTEMKKSTSDLINVDGEEVSVNKVEDALASAGVALRDVNGEFRDLDDVFLELSSKWDGLDKMTQRYVATMAAGSRQQSRFIAMMSDYDRTMELVGAAYDSSGASQRQFEKTQDSLESKLNKLKNAWDEFLMGISNSKVIKAVVDALTTLLNIVNKLTGNSGLAKLAVAIGGLKVGKRIFEGLFKSFAPFGTQLEKTGSDLGTSFLKGLTERISNFTSGKGFVFDIDVGKKGFVGLSNKIADIKQDWSSLLEAMKTPIVRDDAVLVFEKIDDAVVATSMSANGMVSQLEGGLSSVAMSSLAASEGVEEIGEDFVQTGMSGKTALDLIQKEYLETIALAEALDQANDGDIVEFDGDIIKGQFQAGAGNRQYWKGRGETLGKDVKVLESGGTSTLQAFKGLLPVLGKVAIALAAVAAIAASIYALWYFSAEQVQKRKIESLTDSYNTLSSAIEKTQTSLEALNNSWDSLKEQRKTLDSMIAGTYEWQEALVENNRQVTELLQKIPALGEYLKVDENGAYYFDEAGYSKVQSEVSDQLQLQENALILVQQEKEYQEAVDALDTVTPPQAMVFSTGYHKPYEELINAYDTWVDSSSVELLEKLTNDGLIDMTGAVTEAGLIKTDGGITAIEKAINDDTTGNSSKFLHISKDEEGQIIGVTSKTSDAIAGREDEVLPHLTLGEQEHQVQNILQDEDFKDHIEEYAVLDWADIVTYANEGSSIINQRIGSAKGIYTSSLMQQGYDQKTASSAAEFLIKNTDLDDYEKSIADAGFSLSDPYKGGYAWNHGKMVEAAEKYGFSWDESTNVISDASGNPLYTIDFHNKADKKAAEGTETITDEAFGRMLTYMSQGEAVTNSEIAKQTADIFMQHPDLKKIYSTGDETDISADVAALKNEWENVSEIYGGNYDTFLQDLDDYQQMQNQRISDLNAGVLQQYTTDELNGTQVLDLEEYQGLNLLYNDLGEKAREIVDTYAVLALAGSETLAAFNPTTEFQAFAQELSKSSLTAESFLDTVQEIDWSNSITALKDINKLIKDGSQNAELILDVMEKADNEMLSAGTQIVDMFASESFSEILTELEKVYQSTGEITADAIRELGEGGTILADVLDIGTVKAAALAELTEDLASGEINLGEVTKELAQAYNELYYSADLAGDVLARMNKVQIKDSDRELGKKITEIWTYVEDTFDAKAYGDTSLPGYIEQLIGPQAWEEAIAGNNQYDAITELDKKYGFSKNQGNLYGSTTHLINTSDSEGPLSLTSTGAIHYDLSGIQNTEEFINKIADQFKISKEYADAIVADLKIYSKTLGEDLQDLDTAYSANNFFNSRIEKEYDGTYRLNASDTELKTYAKALGYTDTKEKTAIEQLKDALIKEITKNDENAKVVIDDYKKSKKGYYETKTNKDGSVDYRMSANAGKQISDYMTSLDVDVTSDWTADLEQDLKSIQGATVDVEGNFVDAEGNPITTETLDNLLRNEDIRDIILNPQIPAETKQQMFADLGLDEEIVNSLTSEEVQKYTAAYAEKVGTDTYNQLGAALSSLAELLEANEFSVGVTLNFTEGWLQLLNSTGTLTIGGSGTSFGNGGFSPKDYSPEVVDLINFSGTDNSNNGNSGTATTTHDKTNTGSTGSKSSSKEAENDTDPRNKNLDKKIDALDRKLERREIDAVEHQFAKDALYLEKKMALQAQKNSAEAEAEYLGKYYKYDAETDAYLYLEDAYNNASDETKNKIDEEIDKLQGINDELNEIEDAIEDFEFKNPYDEQQFYEAEGDKINTDNELAHIDRQRQENERYRELVGKMPSEMQGPLNLALTGADMFYESQEIGVNLERKAALEQQMRAKYNDSDFYGEYYTWNEKTQSFDINSEALSNPDLRPETRDAIMEEFDEMQGFAKEWRDVSDELSGGFIQDAFKEAGEAAEDLAISFINEGHAADNINDIFDRFEKKLGLNENALDGFGNAIGDVIDSSELLDKTFKGFGIENVNEKINQSPIGGLLSENQKSLLSLVGGEGGTFGELGASLGLNISDALGGIGNLLNFDMMSLGLDMFNGMMGMVDQGKQMIEKIIGYITQATQVIVDAWTNREDYLYNFLKIIEKHLNEYEKLQRRQNQLEKGRTSTVEEIRANYDAQWKSLQQQLEEQQERLETRQKELERSRWNPFSLISGWNPSSDTLYENREVKFMWDLLIGFGQMAPMGLGAFFSQLNQLYEDYDKRVQNSYEDRLAAEQALLDIEDERLELVKYGSEEATEFEQKVLDAMIKKEQEQIDELTRLNDAITDANSKLISTLQDNLEKIRQERENEKKEEELSEKERRLAYLRQDTSGANMLEIKKLEEQLEEEHEDYTDTLIDQKISELEKQNEKAAEQRQQQIDLLQSQLDYAEKYGLYWDAIYGMLYTIDENGNAVLNPENFDIDGNIRENSQLAQMLGTFSDRLGMSVWSAVLDNEEMKRLGRYYGFFIGNNGVTGNWRHQWALDDPGADDPNFAYPDQEIPEGLWGVLYRLEIGIKKYFANSDPDLIDRGGRMGQAFKNFFGKLFGNEEWANYKYEAVNAAHVQSTTFAGMKKLSDDTKEWFKSLFSNNESYGNKTSRNLTGNGAQNIGDINTTNYFQIGNVGETISLDEMVDRVAERFKDMFSIGNNVLGRSRT